MDQRSMGTATRFDNDGAGNHVLREQDKNKSFGRFVLPVIGKKLCSMCKEKKLLKGGSGSKKPWLCADCKNKVKK